jgi:Spherulation-specific family 4
MRSQPPDPVDRVRQSASVRARSNARTARAVALVMLVLGASGATQSATAASAQVDQRIAKYQREQRLLIPAYFYPGANGTAWKKMCDLIYSSRAVAVIVMNANNGVFRHADANYTAAMNYCRSKKQTVVGYVFTDHGTRPLSAVKSNVAHYYQDYPGVRGIFIDEMSNDPQTYPYYRALYAYAKAGSTPTAQRLVIGNPGATASTDWQLRSCVVCLRPHGPVVDILANFEGPYERVDADPAFVTGFTDWVPPAWTSGYPVYKFAHLVYRSTSATITTSACNMSKERRAGWIYVTTDDTDPLWNIAPDTAMLACPTLYRRP